MVDFEVIKVGYDSDSYLDLLRIDWLFDIYTIINIKRISMVFEKNGTRVIVPLYPSKVVRYTEPLCEE